MALIIFLRSHKDKWVIPVITLVVTFLSYALLSPAIRYFQDDWAHIYSLVIRGTEGIKLYYLYNGRPYGYWPYPFFFSLWGTNPLAWHFTNYLLRWLTAIILWVAFRHLWPTHKREVGWGAILFAVYPLFNQQSMGMTFIVHWVCYLLFAVSLLFMILAVRKKKYSVLFLILSVLINIPNLFTIEYFIGIEFIRPFVLWFAFSSEIKKQTKVKKTLLFWSPFLLLSAFYVYWRVFLLNNLRADNSPVLLNNLIHEPISTSIELINSIFRDTLQVILGVWYSTFNIDIFDFGVPAKIASLVLIVIVIVVSIFLYKKYCAKDNELATGEDKQFHIQAIILGLAGVIFGCAPGWLIMRSVSDSYGLWNDRFGMAAIIGACLFIVGIFGVLFKKNQKAREIFLIVLVALAIGRNFSVTIDYKESSKAQNEFFSQLKWRAPYIESRTAIFSDNEYFSNMGVYPTSYEFNVFYPMVELMPRTDYWYFQLHKFSSDQINAFINGEKIDVVKWYTYFEAEGQNSLVINWDQDQENCLWVVTENDRLNPLLSSNTRNSLALTNLDRINPTAQESKFSTDLFGSENRNTWCYYYEKADLARQLGDWSEVTRLFDEAQEKGFASGNGVELMPFIEGFARNGDAQKSLDLTMQAISKTDNISPFLCDNWNRFAPELTADEAVQKVYQDLSDSYGCATYISK